MTLRAVQEPFVETSSDSAASSLGADCDHVGVSHPLGSGGTQQVAQKPPVFTRGDGGGRELVQPDRVMSRPGFSGGSELKLRR